MKIAQWITVVLMVVAPLAVGACTSASTSGTVGAVEPSASSAGVTTGIDGAQPGDTFSVPPEPGFNPDDISEAP
jgi:hypothetical protein